ncbi:MAG TPA: DUF2470 domain-containing protein [Pseudolysinimonas sp.]|jgi:hypothetical protein|nr:DUF2470 domain-containing protein [Pseudolysinimonas sp.]
MSFSPDVVDAVLEHMNGDHPGDNVLIVRAFAGRDVDSAVMSDLDHRGGTWRYSSGGEELELHVPWSSGEIHERPEIRREIVVLYDAACEQLGVEPRPHA